MTQYNFGLSTIVDIVVDNYHYSSILFVECLQNFSPKKDGHGFVSLQTRDRKSWAPYVVDKPCPSSDENVTWLSNLHTLWQVDVNKRNRNGD